MRQSASEKDWNGRSATVRGGVADFFTRKRSVTQIRSRSHLKPTMLPFLFRFAAFLLIISLAYAGWVFVYMQRLIQKGVLIVQNTKPFERSIPNAAQRILFLGDSSAVGVGSARPEETTAGRIAADYPHAEIVNIGVSGMRASDLRAKLSEKINRGHFDIAVIQIGGNDITHATDMKEFEEEMRAVIEQTKQLADKVILLHSGNIGSAPIFPWPVDRYMTYRTRLVRDLYMKLAPEYGITYVDLFKEVKDDIYPKDPAKYYAADLFHHSGAGYGIWYEGIKAALGK